MKKPVSNRRRCGLQRVFTYFLRNPTHDECAKARGNQKIEDENEQVRESLHLDDHIQHHEQHIRPAAARKNEQTQGDSRPKPTIVDVQKPPNGASYNARRQQREKHIDR